MQLPEIHNTCFDSTAYWSNSIYAARMLRTYSSRQNAKSLTLDFQGPSPEAPIARNDNSC